MSSGDQSTGSRLKTPHITRAQLIALVGLTLMWGINWPMMKIAVRELPALYVRGITMGLASLWLMFYFRTRGLRLICREGAANGERDNCNSTCSW